MIRAKRTCFLICPISKAGDPINLRSRQLLERIVAPAVERFGFAVQHFLEPSYTDSQESIRESMMHWLKCADISIADLTGDNANVFFEYGLRRATGRPVLAFIESGGKLAFDVSDYHTPPYDLEHPSEARNAIEDFLLQRGFEVPLVSVSAERVAQSQAIAEYILRNQVRRIRVLQFSLLSIARELSEAWWRIPDLTAAILLMHPDYAKHYAGGTAHVRDIRDTEEAIRRAPQTTAIYGYHKPTLGLWYYQHEPSAAVLMAGEEYLQLGWYFREPEGSKNALRLKGHSQPSLIAEGSEARKLMPNVQRHFEEVWRAAKLVCINGPKSKELEREWLDVKKRLGSEEGQEGKAARAASVG